MKNKKAYIAIICLILIFMALITINYFKKSNNPVQPEEKEPEIVLTENSKIFKNFVFEIDDTVEYKEINKYEFELSTQKWHATLQALIDEYGNIIEYPKCTEKFYEEKGHTIKGDYKYVPSEKYFSFHTNDIVDGKEDKRVVAYYDIGKTYVMVITIKNSDNSFDETAIQEILKILKTVQFDLKTDYGYHYYPADFYHQCHDIDKYDEEDVKRRNEEFEKSFKEKTIKDSSKEQ